MVVPVGTAVAIAAPRVILKPASLGRNGVRTAPSFTLSGMVAATTSHGVSAEALDPEASIEFQMLKSSKLFAKN